MLGSEGKIGGELANGLGISRERFVGGGHNGEDVIVEQSP